MTHRNNGIGADEFKGILQGLKHTLSALDAASAAAIQLIDAQKTGKPLSPTTLEHYSEQFATLTTQREQMRTVIAQWWMLLDDTRH